MSATLFREHCCHVCFVSGTEEAVKTGFCHESVQVASVVVEKQEVVGETEVDD